MVPISKVKRMWTSLVLTFTNSTQADIVHKSHDVMIANKNIFVLELYVLQNSILLRFCHMDGNILSEEKWQGLYVFWYILGDIWRMNWPFSRLSHWNCGNWYFATASDVCLIYMGKNDRHLPKLNIYKHVYKSWDVLCVKGVYWLLCR